jgi:hypothetical protein
VGSEVDAMRQYAQRSHVRREQLGVDEQRTVVERVERQDDQVVVGTSFFFVSNSLTATKIQKFNGDKSALLNH